MHAVAGFDRAEPLPDWNVAQLRREFVAELFCDFGGWRSFEPVLQKKVSPNDVRSSIAALMLSQLS